MANGKGNRGGGGGNSPKLTCRKRWEMKAAVLMLSLDFSVSKPVNGPVTGSVFGKTVSTDIVNGKGSCTIANINQTDTKSTLDVKCESDTDGDLILMEEVLVGQPTNNPNVDLDVKDYEVQIPGQPNELRVLLSVQVTSSNGLPFSNFIGLQLTCLGIQKSVIVNALGIGSQDFGPVEYGKEYEITISTPQTGDTKVVIETSIPAIGFTTAHKLNDRDVDGNYIVPTSFNVTVSTVDEELHTNPVVRVTVQIGTTCHQALTQMDGLVMFMNLPLTVGEKETKYTVWVPGGVHKNCAIPHTHLAANSAVVTPKDKSFFQVLRETLKEQVGKK